MESGSRRYGLGSLLARWVRRGLGALVVAVIDSFVELVDSVLVLVPNPVPTAEQLRQARDLGGLQLRWVGVFARPVRRPVLAGIGAGELLVDRWWAPSAALA